MPARRFVIAASLPKKMPVRRTDWHINVEAAASFDRMD
jgi:hypothetical protein